MSLKLSKKGVIPYLPAEAQLRKTLIGYTLAQAGLIRSFIEHEVLRA